MLYHEVIEVEVHAKEEHEYRYHPLAIQGKASETVILDTESACTGCGESRINRFKYRITSAYEEQSLKKCETDVDEIQDLRCLTEPGNKLADDRSGRFRLHEIDL